MPAKKATVLAFSRLSRSAGSRATQAGRADRMFWSAIREGRKTRLAELPSRPVGGPLKRGTDLMIAGAAVVVLSPLLCLLFLAVGWQSKGRPIFRHTRVGYDGRTFGCFKFRTMVANADQVLAEHLRRDSAAAAEWAASRKLRDDPRVTPLGYLLRVSSLDELPQLFNVLAGSMSIVGPRPIVEEEISRYGSRYDAYRACRPGLTGLWQVSGRSDCGYDQRVRLDQAYVRSWSFMQDVMIIWKTIGVVLRRQGSC